MPNWTKDDLHAYQARRQKLRATEPECPERRPLERAAQREAKGGFGAPVGITGRSRVIYRVYSQRPLDWDNYRLKDLQDCLVQAGLLADDNWRILQGEVISEKVHTKAEERTEVTIIPPVS